MASEVADLWVRLRLLGSEFSTGLKEAGAEAEGFSDKVSKSLQKVALIGAAGLIGLAGASVKMAGDWQESMIKLTTSAGEAGSAINGKLTGEISHVSDALLKMAVQTGTSTKELASGMYYVESAGFHGADALNVMRIAAEGAKAEGAELSTVADGLTTVLHDMGMGADQSVSAMNMMVRAVGDGKMTMQDFASALAAVLPAAHAAGLQFPDVAAALSTMTVAGNSAQHAADMLGHTIASLQTPNAQAVKWMGQMGISASDLKDSLGTRGLLGTITMVDQAILSHMGKDGKVLQSAFNESKSAADDLNIMLGQMPPQLRKWSEAVMNGSMTAKDFTKATNDIPANLKAQASQFLTLYKNANGFNQALRQGTPEADTFAGMLKKVLGDSVDTNTALQIGGQNLAYYAKTAADVSAAGKQAGTDIETWGTITQGFNFRISQARELLATTAIKVGTELLPKLMTLMDFIASKGGPVLRDLGQHMHDALHGAAVTDALNAFKSLWRDAMAILDQAKTSLYNLWKAALPVAQVFAGALFLAVKTVGVVIKDVIGPAVVALTAVFRDHAGLIKFLSEVVLAGLIAKLIYTKTLLALDMFKTFAEGISSAITGLMKFGQSVGSGQIFDTIRLKAMYAADAIKTVGAAEETAAAEGAAAAGAQGFGAFAGKLATALPLVGGVAVGVMGLASWIGHLGEKSVDASKQMTDFTNMLLDVAAGADGTTQKLEQLAAFAVKSGSLGSQMIKPIDQSLAQLVQSGHLDQANKALANIDLMLKQNGQDSDKFNGKLKDFNDAVGAYNVSQREAALSTSNTTDAMGNFPPTLDAATTSIDGTTGATNALADATANAFQQQQDMSAGLNADRAMDDFTKSVQTLTQSFKDNGTSLKGNSLAAMNNRDALRGSIQAIVDTYNANVQNNMTTADATQKMKDQIKQLVDQSSQSASTRKSVQAYIDTLKLIQPEYDTTLNVDTRAAMTAIQRMLADTGVVTIGGNIVGHGKGQSRMAQYAQGGFVGGAKGAPQLAIVHGGEYVVSLEEQESVATTGGTGPASPVHRGGGGVSVHFHISGSVIAERDLRDLVQTQMLQLGARFSTSYTPYKR